MNPISVPGLPGAECACDFFEIILEGKFIVLL